MGTSHQVILNDSEVSVKPVAIQDRMLHIHGSAEARDDELIPGHAWVPESRASFNDKADIADMDTRLMEANSIIGDYFCATFKPSQKLIAKHRHFFEGLSGVKQVMILSHSLSALDEAYFQYLFLQKSVAAAQWFIACRSEEEWIEKSRKRDLMGIRPGSDRQVSWDTF